MNDTLGGSLVDNRYGSGQSFLGGSNVLALYCFADSFDKGLECRADVLVAGVFYLVLLDTFKS